MLELVHRNRLDDMFVDLFTPLTTSNTLVPLDVIEEDSGYKVVADVPGVSKESIDINFKGFNLAIKVTKPKDEEGNKQKYLCKERKTIEWARTLTFGKDVDPDSISASLREGVLTITVNKLPIKEVKRITIN